MYKQLFVVHRIIEYPELQRAHKDHQIQLLALHSLTWLETLLILVTHGQVIHYTCSIISPSVHFSALCGLGNINLIGAI